MKNKSLILTLMATTMLSTNAMASEIMDSGTCGDNCNWEIDEDYNLTITNPNYDMFTNDPDDPYYGKIDNYGSGAYAPWAEYMADLESVTIGEGIGIVGDSAFEWSTGHITEISLPSTLLEIGAFAFDGIAVESISIPDSVQSIGKAAFRSEDLTEIRIAPNLLAGSQDGQLYNEYLIDDYYQRGMLTDDAYRDIKQYIQEHPGQKYNMTRDIFGVLLANYPDDRLNNLTIICNSTDPKACQNAMKYYNYSDDSYQILDKNGNPLSSGPIIEKRQNADGSYSIFKDNQFIGYEGKKIYTLDEANAITGMTNRVSIKYR